MGAHYSAIIQLWENAWSEFAPFLDYDIEIRRVICSTNAVESLNARYRRAIRARGHFPTEQVATRYHYLETRSLDPPVAVQHDGHSGGNPHSTRWRSLQRPDRSDWQLGQEGRDRRRQLRAC